MGHTKRKYLSAYNKTAKFKEKRNHVRFGKLRVGKVKLAKANAKALTYGSEMAGQR